MTYQIPKNVVVQMGNVDADTLCGLPCSYYLDYNNLTNIPPNAGLPDFTGAGEGDVLSIDATGSPAWTTLDLSIDGGAAATLFSAANGQTINAGGA